MNFGNAPSEQADGFSGAIEDLTEAITGGETETDNDPELVEELADTVTIEKLMDAFIAEVGEILGATVEVSLDGNPVRTHLELTNAEQDIIELAYELRQELISNVAVRAEQITEQNGIAASPISAATHPSEMRKQVIPDEEN